MQESSSSPGARTGTAVVFLILVAVLMFRCLTAPVVEPPPPPTASASPAPIQIVPGEAAGQISIGTTLEDCERILGPANLAENVDDGQLVTWRDMDISVQMAKGGHPIQPSDKVETSNIVTSILIRSEHYATDSNIKVGSSIAEVQKAFGPADNTNGLLSYPAAGINFLLEGDKVSEIIVFPKSDGG